MLQENYATRVNVLTSLGDNVLEAPLRKAKKTNIVLADDDIDEQYFFEAAVKELPAEVTVKTVSDGILLMEYLLEAATLLPDVIFLDIKMPCKDGIECLKDIKSDGRLQHIPVIMYSTSAEENFIDETYECGASYFLQKGRYTDLKESISELLVIISQSIGRCTIEEFRFTLSRR